MKYYIAKHAKLRLQCLCGETLNVSLQSACIFIHQQVILNCCPATTPFSHFYTLPPAPASALCPATAARQGGSVAASLVDSCEFGTADKRGYCS